MRKWLLLLIPLALFAQVEIDTVIYLPYNTLYNGIFITELNKLYVFSDYRLFVVDCSTYQLKTEIPLTNPQGYAYFAWVPRWQKLYFSVNGVVTDGVVIDAISDTVMAHLTVGAGEMTYAASVDRIYFNGYEAAPIYDCSTDSIVSWLRSPLSGYSVVFPWWDSVGNKIYVGLQRWNSPSYLAVYDCSNNDSLLALIPALPLGIMNPNYRLRKAYYVPELWGGACVVDTKNDTVRSLHINSLIGDLNPIAVDTLDDKVYILGTADMTREPDTVYVVDCITDSIIKKVSYLNGPSTVPAALARWIPWSNRVYFCNYFLNNPLFILDCRTDSIILQLSLGEIGPCDIQIDPVRQRVFAITPDFNWDAVYVLRDVMPGVEERKVEMSGNLSVPTVVRNILFLPSAASGERLAVSAYLLDIAGRKVLDLFPGANDIPHLAPGVYFIRANSSRGLSRILIVR